MDKIGRYIGYIVLYVMINSLCASTLIWFEGRKDFLYMAIISFVVATVGYVLAKFMWARFSTEKKEELIAKSGGANPMNNIYAMALGALTAGAFNLMWYIGLIHR